jgi:hypothetical protein
MAVYDDVVTRLAMLGYTATDADEASITYAVNQSAAYILTQTNLTEMPDGLYYTQVDYAAGLFLQAKSISGGLSTTLTGGGLKAVTEGDVKVEYDTTNTPESRLTALIAGLMTISESVLAAYRRLKW